MDQPVYVAAVWSIAHGTWAEFIVSPDGAKVRGVCDLLALHTATQYRIVRVERDDWDLIRPALAKLSAPEKDYTPREAAMFFDGWREVGRELDCWECDNGDPRPVAVEVGLSELCEAAPFERRRRN